ncbi:MAG: hypothetical protein A2Z02_06150 [Chloroflexi bacterium RBG_16_48_7]|nr:MAG: hypothetical protein A2Z02_06150 [Chloroflexi bacterium RBG_16_48_7]
MVMKVERLTISIPSDLLKLADEIAKEKKISRSKVVSSCLQEMAQKRLEERMAEGYRKMAKESLAFAHEAMNLGKETLPEWK